MRSIGGVGARLFAVYLPLVVPLVCGYGRVAARLVDGFQRGADAQLRKKGPVFLFKNRVRWRKTARPRL